MKNNTWIMTRPKYDRNNNMIGWVDVVYGSCKKCCKNDTDNKLKEYQLVLWCEENGYEYECISDIWFQKNSHKIDYEKYDPKLKKGMNQFL